MADTLSQADLDKLVEQFQAIKNADEKARFFHENLPLHRIFSGIHFPKPADKPATT